MQLNQTNQMGQRMQFDGVLDLNEVDEIWMQEELLCNIYLTGRDMAGNALKSLQIIVETNHTLGICTMCNQNCSRKCCKFVKITNIGR